ncbi:sporulation integral membrane protein YtvI [Ornithinibacillus caprae]|nr:sporulation integral membrane protein YtvI [Ornithinibacillus caprae]
MYKQVSNQILRCVMIIAIILGCYFLFVYTIPFTYPFLIAIGVSFLINPLVTLLEEKGRVPRTLATFIVIIFIFFILIGIIFLIISEIIQGTIYLADMIPTYFQSFISIIEEFVYTKLLPLYETITSYFNTLHPAQQETISDKIQQFLNNITTTGTTLLQSFFLNIPTVILVLPNSVTIILFIILATFFITKDWNSLKEHIHRSISQKAMDFFKNISIHFKRAFAGYLKAQSILISITTCIILIGLMILQVEHALTITFIAAIFDILPFIGTGMIFIPWIIYSFVTANYAMTISLSILFGIIIVVRQILEPKVLSDSIGVNPLFGLFILFICIQIWGVMGILFAPIVMISFYVLIQSGAFLRIWSFIKG